MTQAVDEIIKSAPHVARVDVRQPAHRRDADGDARRQRPLRRGKTDSYDLRVCSQSAGTVRDQIAPVLGVDKRSLRVTTEDVGGAFGMKSDAYPEYSALLVGREEASAAGVLDVDAARKPS